MFLLAACGLVAATSAFALEQSVVSSNGPQDFLYVPQIVDELGTNATIFPWNELISSLTVGTTDEHGCFDGYDDLSLTNWVVQITNLTPFDFTSVWYVADPETQVSNYDGWVANWGFVDYEEAFKIDWLGINRPLIYESMGSNNVFEAGETWRFILQDWTNSLGGSPSDFSSAGVSSNSTGLPSTGSIIAVPEPGSLGLLALGAVAIAVLCRRRK
jgi:hypothetical protein